MKKPKYRVGQRLMANDGYRGSQVITARVKEIRKLNGEYVYFFDKTFVPGYEDRYLPYDS